MRRLVCQEERQVFHYSRLRNICRTDHCGQQKAKEVTFIKGDAARESKQGEVGCQERPAAQHLPEIARAVLHQHPSRDGEKCQPQQDQKSFFSGADRCQIGPIAPPPRPDRAESGQHHPRCQPGRPQRLIGDRREHRGQQQHGR